MRRMRHVLVLFLFLSLGMAARALAQEKKRNLLVIGQSKGYQHDSVSDGHGHALSTWAEAREVGHVFPDRLHGHHQEAPEVGSQEPRMLSTPSSFSPTATWTWMTRKRRTCCHSSTTTAKGSSASTAPPSRSSAGRSTAR